MCVSSTGGEVRKEEGVECRRHSPRWGGAVGVPHSLWTLECQETCCAASAWVTMHLLPSECWTRLWHRRSACVALPWRVGVGGSGSRSRSCRQPDLGSRPAPGCPGRGACPPRGGCSQAAAQTRVAFACLAAPISLAHHHHPLYYYQPAHIICTWMPCTLKICWISSQ